MKLRLFFSSSNRIRYWSNSRLAQWIRGTVKPKYGTGDEWAEWDKSAKEAHPIRFWIAEEFLNFIQNIWCLPMDVYDHIRCYLKMRFVVKPNALTAERKYLKPGSYCDLTARFLPCMFGELVRFVEYEKASMNYVWTEGDTKEKYGKFHWLHGNREAGLAYLDWEIGLKTEEDEVPIPTAQSVAAQEIKDLYLWWTEVYPNRPDPHDVSGWTDYCERRRESGLGFMQTDPNEDPDETERILKECDRIEAEYEAEDEAMMIRLIKIRGSLWT
ncbi:MAG: hypothetical protein WCY93_08660 [Anaerolineaceae bacterium]